MGLFGNYENAGPGIPKNNQEKTDFFKFFEIYGRRFWKLMSMNLLYTVFFVPILGALSVAFDDRITLERPTKVLVVCFLALIFALTIGPATSGVTKITRNYSQERNAFIWSDFWSTFKKCYRQSVIMGVIDFIFACGFYVSIVSYSAWAQKTPMMYVPFVICLSCMIMFIMMHFYIYHLIISTNLSFTKILKNSFLLVGISLKRSLLNLVVVVFIVFLVMFFFPYSVFIIPFLPFGFAGLMISFNCYPFIRKYVIQPYYQQRGEENPEDNYEITDEKSIFRDRGGEETPIKKKKRRF